MEAIILAGGFGTRLRDVVSDLPKPMAPIGNRPFLEILLGMLSQKGFTRVTCSLGYMSEKIVSHFGNSFNGMELCYVVEESPLGTGGAVKLALTQCKDDHVFVFNGDTYLDIDVDQVELNWQKNRSPIIIGRWVPDTERYGRLVVSDGCVVDFNEKGIAGPGLINAGCYVLGARQLDGCRLQEKFSLESDYLVQLVKNEIVRCCETNGLFIDIGIPDDYERAQNLLGSCG